LEVLVKLFALIGAALVLVACDGEGALGQAAVNQGCDPSDPSCQKLALDAPIAVGASLPLAINLSLQGGGSPPLTLVSGNDDVFTISGQTLTGEGTGAASLLVTSEGDLVLDFTTIWVQLAGGLVVDRRSADGALLGEVKETLELVPAEEAVVSVTATSTSKQPLLGAPFATWSSDSPAVTVVDDGVQGQARLVARAAGPATITVLAFGLQQSFDVEVTP
jgi:hypothetical protein